MNRAVWCEKAVWGPTCPLVFFSVIISALKSCYNRNYHLKGPRVILGNISARRKEFNAKSQPGTRSLHTTPGLWIAIRLFIPFSFLLRSGARKNGYFLNILFTCKYCPFQKNHPQSCFDLRIISEFNINVHAANVLFDFLRRFAYRFWSETVVSTMRGGTFYADISTDRTDMRFYNFICRLTSRRKNQVFLFVALVQFTVNLPFNCCWCCIIIIMQTVWT